MILLRKYNALLMIKKELKLWQKEKIVKEES